MADESWDSTLDDLRARREAAAAMGGAEKLEQQRQQGKMDARARVRELVDPGSFTEIGQLVGTLPAEGFIAGIGRIAGRNVAVGAEDFTVAGGSIGQGGAAKRHRLAELALQERMPLVTLLDGAGHRPPLPNDPPTRRAPGDIQALADASGKVPLVAAVLGPSAGHGALSAPLSDFTVMTPHAAIFTAGPPLVKASIGEDISKEDLGGPDVALASGVIHNLARDDAAALRLIRRWLSYLPSSAWEHPPVIPVDGGDRAVPELLDIVPRNPRHTYDMVDVVDAVVDEDTWLEVQPDFGPSLLTGLARLGGRPIAIVANQPRVMAGTITADAADKAAHFVQVADAFHLPLFFLTDNPGVLAGSASERLGILRHAGRMFAAQHQTSVPKVQLTLRKAYGFGSTVMSMNPFDNQTLNLAYPGVTFGAMPARGADAAIGADDAGKEALRAAELASGYRSAAGLSVDAIIDPTDTRSALLDALALASSRLRGPAQPKARGGNLR